MMSFCNLFMERPS